MVQIAPALTDIEYVLFNISQGATAHLGIRVFHRQHFAQYRQHGTCGQTLARVYQARIHLRTQGQLGYKNPMIGIFQRQPRCAAFHSLLQLRGDRLPLAAHHRRASG